ncbi:MAG: MutS-related protein, partial [Gammaproteobacteria bacterium]
SFVLLLPVALLYVPAVGGFDRDQFVYPLRDCFRAADEVRCVLAALGRIDELLALHRYARSFGSATVLPRVVDSPRHFLRLRGARNPILGYGNHDYVPNDIDLETTRLTFITGPNSGGKTALCKTIAQVQLLAQSGGYVPASEAEVAISDRIFYQTPEAGSLTDAEGRFGTELARTKSIFLGASPKSLVILDEMAEGTTYEEKLAISEAILSGFGRIGNSTNEIPASGDTGNPAGNGLTWPRSTTHKAKPKRSPGLNKDGRNRNAGHHLGFSPGRRIPRSVRYTGPSISAQARASANPVRASISWLR